MGIETVLLIVNEKSLEKVLNSEWNELYQLMDKGNMRHIRPEKIPRLNRSFDIDCEADVLDWMESIGKQEGTVKQVLLSIEDGEEGLLQFMQFASPGHWGIGRLELISTLMWHWGGKLRTGKTSIPNRLECREEINKFARRGVC